MLDMLLAWALSFEEMSLLQAGLLPPNYPALARELTARGPEAAIALAREGQKGPFSLDFGDPQEMLKAARYAAGHPGYAEAMQSLHRGDLLFVAPNRPDNFVVRFSGGPFSHVLLCTDPTPPGRFIEAVGATREAGDWMSDRVRVASASRYARPEPTFRVVHLADGRPAVAESAIAFAESQLGKPYNWSFSDTAGRDRGYTCSSLVHEAYRHAGLTWRPSKTPARDRIGHAVKAVVMALEPDDPMDITLSLMRHLHTNPAPSHRATARFIVQAVLPRCHRLAPIAKPRQLENTLTAMLDGKIQPADRLRRLQACLHAGAVLAAVPALVVAAAPYADVLAALFTGPDSGLTHTTASALRALDQLHLPLRAPWTTLSDVITPTDLAWTDLPHEDFQVRADMPISGPWPHALVRGKGRFHKALPTP